MFAICSMELAILCKDSVCLHACLHVLASGKTCISGKFSLCNKKININDDTAHKL